MAAVISSTSMLNLLPSCYPSIYNFNNNTNICLPKKTLMPTISCLKKKTTTSTLKISNNKEKSKYNNVNIIVASSPSSTRSSPWLMLPSTEAKNNEVHTLYGRCFYDIGEKTFVPPIKYHPKNTTSSSDDHHLDPLNRDHHRQIYHEYLSDGVKCVGASHGWLAFIDRRDCSLFLCNPLTSQTIELPPIQTLSAFPGGACYRKLDDGSFKIAGFISKTRWRDGNEEEDIFTCRSAIRSVVSKIILTSSPLEKDCVVVLSTYNTLAFCKVGDDKWTDLNGGRDRLICDVVYRTKDNKIYIHYIPKSLPEFIEEATTTKLASWDISDASSPQITHQKFRIPELTKDRQERYRKMNVERRDRYLVESPSSGKLLMVARWSTEQTGSCNKYPYIKQLLEVLRSFMAWDKKSSCNKYPYKTVLFDVFEFDEEKKELVEVRDLGGMALFVGIHHSMAVNAREVPGLIPNAIYFDDIYGNRRMESLKKYGYQIPSFIGHDFGIYNVGDGSVTSPCYSTQSKHFLPPPVWIVP